MNDSWTASHIPSQQGRRVVITGANGRLGFQTALELARRGAEVIVPARTQAKGPGCGASTPANFAPLTRRRSDN